MKMTRFLILTALLTLAAAVQAAVEKKIPTRDETMQPRVAQDIRSEAGLNIPDWGIAIDAFFDSRLTGLVPGYHIVNLVITNRRNDPIRLDPSRDKWVIVDHVGHKHTARNHVKTISRDLWERLPDNLRQRLEYPVAIKPGKFATVDVFLPESVELDNFREVVWRSSFFNKEFNIYTNYEKSLSLGVEDGQNGAEELPEAPSGLTTFNPEDYSKSREEILNADGENRNDRWRREQEERERKKYESENRLNFDPSFDDAIIIR